MEQEKTSAEDPKHSWEKMKYCCSFKDYKNKTNKPHNTCGGMVVITL